MKTDFRRLEAIERYNKIIYVILIVVILGALAYVYHSYELVIVLAVFAAFLIISNIFNIFIARNITFLVSFEDEYVKRGNKTKVIIVARNKKILPVMKLGFYLRMKAMYSDGEQRRYFNISVPAYGERKTEIYITPQLSGRIVFSIEQALASEVLAFKSKEVDSGGNFVVDVLPSEVNVSSLPKSAEGIADEGERIRRDEAGSEVLEIREYAPGDSLKSIHWKMSAKKDELYVRVRGDNMFNCAVLLFELTRADINGVLDVVYSTCLDFAEHNEPLRLYWAGAGEEKLSLYDINEKDDINKAFKSIYSSQTAANGASLRAARRQLSNGSVMYISDSQKGIRNIRL